MLAYVNIEQLTVTPVQLAWRKFPKEILSVVLDEDTGEIMDYRKLIKNPKYHPLYQDYYAKEIGRLAQGMTGLVEGTKTMFFIDKTVILTNRWKDVTYG